MRSCLGSTAEQHGLVAEKPERERDPKLKVQTGDGELIVMLFFV